VALGGKKIAEAKVDDLDVSSLANQDVLDLEISVDDAVSMAVIEGTGDLSAELPSLLLLQPSMRDDVVKHLSTIDVFKEHVPVVGRPHDIAHATDKWVVQESHDGSFSGCSDLLGVVSSLPICSTLVMSTVFCRASRHNLDRNLQSRVSSTAIAYNSSIKYVPALHLQLSVPI
jgi:hypothetical protein